MMTICERCSKVVHNSCAEFHDEPVIMMAPGSAIVAEGT
jgi:hypothetical protein